MPPPMRRGITYKLQERKYGGLSMATARKLEQAAAGALYLILQNRLYRGEIAHRLSRAKVAAALEAGGASQRPDLDPIVVSIEAKLRRAGKGKAILAGITIVHISTELRLAWRHGLEAALAENSDEVVPYKIYCKSLSAMAAVASERLRLFNEG